ncbi:hypothetical protein HDV01_002120 [Terramyces sp. JEL0728]|nr:hypothetical protein HDV01_002120 [Terramyces sp. JEL0728]
MQRPRNPKADQARGNPDGRFSSNSGTSFVTDRPNSIEAPKKARTSPLAKSPAVSYRMVRDDDGKMVATPIVRADTPQYFGYDCGYNEQFCQQNGNAVTCSRYIQANYRKNVPPPNQPTPPSTPQSPPPTATGPPISSGGDGGSQGNGNGNGGSSNNGSGNGSNNGGNAGGTTIGNGNGSGNGSGNSGNTSGNSGNTSGNSGNTSGNTSGNSGNTSGNNSGNTSGNTNTSTNNNSGSNGGVPQNQNSNNGQTGRPTQTPQSSSSNGQSVNGVTINGDSGSTNSNSNGSNEIPITPSSQSSFPTVPLILGAAAFVAVVSVGAAMYFRNIKPRKDIEVANLHTEEWLASQAKEHTDRPNVRDRLHRPQPTNTYSGAAEVFSPAPQESYPMADDPDFPMTPIHNSSQIIDESESQPRFLITK